MKPRQKRVYILHISFPFDRATFRDLDAKVIKAVGRISDGSGAGPFWTRPGIKTRPRRDHDWEFATKALAEAAEVRIRRADVEGLKTGIVRRERRERQQRVERRTT